MIGPSQFSAYLHALPAAEQPGVVHVDADLDGEHFSVLAALRKYTRPLKQILWDLKTNALSQSEKIICGLDRNLMV